MREMQPDGCAARRIKDLDSRIGLSGVIDIVMGRTYELRIPPPFDVAVKSMEREIMRFLMRSTGDREDAKDLFQETWLRAYRAYPTLRSEDGLRPWIFRIASNLCRNRVRDRMRRMPHAAPGAVGPRHHRMARSLRTTSARRRPRHRAVARRGAAHPALLPGLVHPSVDAPRSRARCPAADCARRRRFHP